MTTDKTGGAAFPTSQERGNVLVIEGGMTLRDYMAAAALHGVISSRSWDKTGHELINQWAATSYSVADAMIAARNLQPPPPSAGVEALEAVKNWYDNQECDAPVDAGCVECTAGTVPDRLNTGLCAFHKVFKVLK